MQFLPISIGVVGTLWEKQANTDSSTCFSIHRIKAVSKFLWNNCEFRSGLTLN